MPKHQDTITQEVLKVLDENKHPAARRARGKMSEAKGTGSTLQ